ncbi:hypothetical protein [Nocardioides sp. LHG3406-4]|uniref:hypothetical protein n=1 Tax=Nocardioides sp. LHG3406-4 TaxID=2804575 RepID=UPI003CF39742
MNEWDGSAWVVVGACALLAALCAIVLAWVRATTRREVASARAEAAQLRRRLEELERTIATRHDDGAKDGAIEPVVVSTSFDLPRSLAGPAPIEGRLFADLVLRESVVKAASWAHGVRRALSPENRNRIAFEMRRELKRSRKSRRAEVQEALRAHRARQREGGPDSKLGSEDAA